MKLVIIILLFMVSTLSAEFIRTYDLIQDGDIKSNEKEIETVFDGTGELNVKNITVSDTITAETITAQKLNIVDIEITTISGTTAEYINLDVTDTADIKELSADTLTVNNKDINSFINNTNDTFELKLDKSYTATTDTDIPLSIKNQYDTEIFRFEFIDSQTFNAHYINPPDFNLIGNNNTLVTKSYVDSLDTVTVIDTTNFMTFADSIVIDTSEFLTTSDTTKIEAMIRFDTIIYNDTDLTADTTYAAYFEISDTSTGLNLSEYNIICEIYDTETIPASPEWTCNFGSELERFESNNTVYRMYVVLRDYPANYIRFRIFK
jgi:hypothetical protein